MRSGSLRGTDPPPADMGLDDFVDHMRGLTSPSCPMCSAVEAGPDGGPCSECRQKVRDPLGIHNFWRNIADRLGF